jgi:hypothetical protein
MIAGTVTAVERAGQAGWEIDLACYEGDRFANLEDDSFCKQGFA